MATIRSLEKRLLALKTEVEACLQHLDDLYDSLYESDEDPTPEPMPTPPVVVAPPPAAPPPAPVPSPTPSPTPSAASSVIRGVVATCWGNREDEAGSCWSSMAYAWSPRCSPGSGKTTPGAALPCRIPQGTVCDVGYQRPGGAYVWARGVPVIDVGPWNTHDPYWRTLSRPAAESGTDERGRKTNKAGIDLTPYTWAQLLGISADRVWAASPSAKVDVVVYEPGATPTAEPDAPKLSTNFKVSEAEATTHGPNTLPASLLPNAQRLALEVLEPLRAALGKGFSPNSWYRSPAVNEAVGGVGDSAHQYALAADVPRTDEFLSAIVKAGLPASVRVLIEPDHIHLELPDAKNKPAGVEAIKGAVIKEGERRILNLLSTALTSRIPIVGTLLKGVLNAN